MNYESAKAIKATFQGRADEASVAFRQFPKGSLGLIPDEVKASPEWQAAKRNWDKASADLGRFNAVFLREFGRQYREECRARRSLASNP